MDDKERVKELYKKAEDSGFNFAANYLNIPADELKEAYNNMPQELKKSINKYMNFYVTSELNNYYSLK